MHPDSPQTPTPKTTEADNAREAAYLAVLISLREDKFVSDLLSEWKSCKNPSDPDYRFAREIAYGSIRMRLALDFIAERLADRQKLNVKLREKVLLRTAIYQHYYMDRVPMHAIAHESVEIAKKYCHETFIRFLNAVLRRAAEERIELPGGDTVPNMSLRYSYPPYFVQEIVQNYGLHTAIEIMEAGNRSGLVTFRIRPNAENDIKKKQGIELLTGTLSPTAIIRDFSLITEIACSPNYYIQNTTTAELVFSLAKDVLQPARVLDLCGSPGGKIITVHDLFPSAQLVVNDVSSVRVKTLSENMEKYGICATVTMSKGEDYTSSQPFDLVILDVPCSNSGVLNKRPEARWRLSQKEIEQLEQLQLQLLKNAATLITENGEIWYMTCSILKRENSYLIEKACDSFHLQVRKKERILPNSDGWDGGFACALRKK